MNYKIVIDEMEVLKELALKKKCIPLANKIQGYISNIRDFHKK